MSSWEIFQNLEDQLKRNILTELEAEYGGSFEFETFIYLVQWMEAQPWDQAIDASSASQVTAAKGLMDATIAQLNEQKKKLETVAFGVNFQNVLLAKKVQEVANQLQEKYGNNPVLFAMCFHDIVSKLRELVQKASMGSSDLSTIDSEDMNMDDSVQVDPYMGVLKDLETLMVDSQKNDALLKEIEQLKEQYVIKFQEVTGKMNRLQQEATKLQGNNQLSETEKAEKISAFKHQSECLQQELSKMGEELSVTKRLALIECMGTHLKKLSEILKSVLEEISEWRHQQQRSLCGFPCPQPLDKLQKVCESQAELLWKLFQQSSQLDNLFRQAFQGNEIELRRMENVKNTTRNLLALFLNKTFIIERQPPQVLKKETKFGATLLHLIGGKLNVQFHPPEVNCILISEKQAQSLNVAGRSKSNLPTSNNTILNNKKALEYNLTTGKLMVEFKNLSLTKANRQGGKNKESVTEEKSAVLFSAQINLGKEAFNVSVMSVPVVVTVHGNQQCDAEATVFWENAFAEKERKLFDVPDQVVWSRLSEALNNYWMLRNGRGLSVENIAYLGCKLTTAKVEGGIENALITRQMFNRDHMTSRSFSFWKWFYGALDVVYRRLVDEWRDGHVAGFLSKKDAHEALTGTNPGTFLLRFSDSELGGVSVAYVAQLLNGQHEIWDLAPWTSTHLQMRKFADRLKDLQELVMLYPATPKDEAFGRYYTNDESEAAENPTGYRPTVLAIKLPRTQACRSPAHPGANNFMDTLPPCTFPITGLPNMTDELFPGSPVSPQSVDCSVVLDTDLGVGSQEIVGDMSELTLSDLFLSGLQPFTPGSASWVAAMVANLGPEFGNCTPVDDNAAQSQ